MGGVSKVQGQSEFQVEHGTSGDCGRTELGTYILISSRCRSEGGKPTKSKLKKRRGGGGRSGREG